MESLCRRIRKTDRRTQNNILHPISLIKSTEKGSVCVSSFGTMMHSKHAQKAYSKR